MVTGLSVVAALGIGVCLSASCNNPWFSAEEKRDMEEVLEKDMAENDIPGAIFGVSVPGRETWIHTGHTAALRTGQDIQSTEKVRIASTTLTERFAEDDWHGHSK